MAEHSEERSYIAFISYRHKELDREAAIALQKKIEHFKIPKELRDETGNERLGYCFRDEDELPTSSSLSDSIRYALDHTRFLIVICTPDLPQSEWCAEEIRYFLSTHDRDHLLAVLVNGEPEESFSPYMTHIYDENGDVLKNVEPLAANITGTSEHYSRPKFKKESIRIIAALLGCPFDELWQRERRYQNRRKALFGAAAFAAMAVFAIVVGAKNLQISAKNAEITAQNEQITTQNQQITAQNNEITEKNQELQVREGKLLEEAGELLLEGHDLSGAAANAKAALEIEGVHTKGAELLLANALSAYSASHLRLDLAAEQDTAIDRCAMLNDGSITYTSDHYGVIRAFSEKKELWSFSAVPVKNRAEYLKDGRSTALYLVDSESILLVGNAYYVAGLSARTGELLWELEKAEAVNFLEVSPDGTCFAVFNDMEDSDEHISFRSTKDGKTISSFYLPQIPFDYSGVELHYHYTFNDYTLGKSYGGNFSADGRYFMCGAEISLSSYELLGMDVDAWIAENLDTQQIEQSGIEKMQGKTAGGTEDDDMDKRKEIMVYSVVDLKEASLTMVGKERICSGMNPVFGCSYDPENKTLFFTRHDEQTRSTYAGFLDKDGNITYTFQHMNIRYRNSSVPWSFLEGNQKIVLSSANSLYVFDKTTGAFSGRYELDRNITFCKWVDRENDVLLVVMEDSIYHVYPLSWSSTDVFLETDKNLSLNNLTHVTGCNGDLFQWDNDNHSLNSAGGKLLLLSGDSPQKVYTAEFFTDPNAKRIQTGSFFKKTTYYIPSQNENLLYLLERIDENLVVHPFDLTSGSFLEDLTLSNLSYLPDKPFWFYPNGKTILFGDRIFKSDGSSEYLEYTEDGAFGTLINHAVSGQMQDGTVISAYLIRIEENKDQIFVWKDGRALCTFSVSDDTAFLLNDGSTGAGTPGETVLLEVSDNGRVIGGIRKADEKRYTGYFLVSPEGKASTLKAVSGTNPSSILRFAKTSDLFAVLEDDGVIRIYDPANEKPVNEIRSSDGFAGAVDLCFAADDQYLGVLSYNGELSLYDTKTGGLLMKDQDSALATPYGTVSLSLQLTRDKTRLFCIVTETEYQDKSNCAIYDLNSFERLADITDILAYFPASDQVLLFKIESNTRKFFLCPLYTGQSLLQQAQ